MDSTDRLDVFTDGSLKQGVIHFGWHSAEGHGQGSVGAATRPALAELAAAAVAILAHAGRPIRLHIDSTNTVWHAQKGLLRSFARRAGVDVEAVHAPRDTTGLEVAHLLASEQAMTPGSYEWVIDVLTGNLSMREGFELPSIPMVATAS